jgi:hypothetical protein
MSSNSLSQKAVKAARTARLPQCHRAEAPVLMRAERWRAKG